MLDMPLFIKIKFIVGVEFVFFHCCLAYVFCRSSKNRLVCGGSRSEGHRHTVIRNADFLQISTMEERVVRLGKVFARALGAFDLTRTESDG